MSIAVRAATASIDADSLSSNNLKEELKEQSVHANFGKDLGRKTSEKPVLDDEHGTQVNRVSAAAADDDGSLKSILDSSVSSHEQHENDEVDQSKSISKQEVIGSIDISSVSVSKEVEVKILSMSIASPGRSDVVMPIPFPTTSSKATLFTLKEGSKYRTIFHFTVSNNTVNCLYYTYMVWKAGVRVCNTKKMMGTFGPRKEPYTFELEEGTTPSGFFARGPFLVRSKFVDDDGKCYLDTTYYFDIRKDWGARDKC